MNDNQFKHQIKQQFEQEVPDVLNQIKASPQFRVPPKERVFDRLFGRPNKALATLVGVFVVSLILVFSIRQLSDPIVASTVTLDVTPSIVITLDEDDNVISVTTLNDAGEEVLQRNIRYRGLSIDEVVDILVTRLEALGFIVTTDTDTNVILIEVDSKNATIQARVEEAFRNRLNDKMDQFDAPHWVLNARDIPLDDDHAQEFQHGPVMNLQTRARLTLVYRIHELDDSYVIDDLLEMRIRDLYDLFISLEDPDNLPDYNQMPGHRPPMNDPYSGLDRPCNCGA